MTTENVAKALAALKYKQVMSESLFARADLVRRERNRYAHTAGLNAELDYTLRLIAVMREVADLGQPPTKGSWQTEKGTQWDSTLTVLELEAYVEKASNFIKRMLVTPRAVMFGLCPCCKPFLHNLRIYH